MTGISKSQVSRLCGEIDERVDAFLDRPLEGEWPYLWLDATYIKVRRSGRIVSVAAIVAVAVNTPSRALLRNPLPGKGRAARGSGHRHSAQRSRGVLGRVPARSGGSGAAWGQADHRALSGM